MVHVAQQPLEVPAGDVLEEDDGEPAPGGACEDELEVGGGESQDELVSCVERLTRPDTHICQNVSCKSTNQNSFISSLKMVFHHISITPERIMTVFV